MQQGFSQDASFSEEKKTIMQEEIIDSASVTEHEQGKDLCIEDEDKLKKSAL